MLYTQKSFELDVETGSIVQAFLLALETSFSNRQKHVIIVQKILPFYIIVSPPLPTPLFSSSSYYNLPCLCSN